MSPTPLTVLSHRANAIAHAKAKATSLINGSSILICFVRFRSSSPYKNKNRNRTGLHMSMGFATSMKCLKSSWKSNGFPRSRTNQLSDFSEIQPTNHFDRQFVTRLPMVLGGVFYSTSLVKSNGVWTGSGNPRWKEKHDWKHCLLARQYGRKIIITISHSDGVNEP